MRVVPLLAPLLILLASCGPAPDPASAARPPGRGTAVRVVSWNVHDLFDEADQPAPPGQYDTVPAPAEVEAKLAALAAVLARLDADVVVLQEVENLPLLERLADRAGYAEAWLVDGFDPRGIDVGALSRLPVEAYRSHLGEVDGEGRRLWPRDCVEVHLRTAGRPLVVVGSHLSSGLSDDGTRRREQAARLRSIADRVRAARPDALVVAGGDLNDAPASAALAPLLGDAAWLDPLPPGATTWQGAGGEARFDYLLVPAPDRAAVAGAAVAAGADVARASDHRPVVLDLRLR
jgi:endonuclease/exonuclease/phosphatase family metal-dependent hydrolase